MTLAYAQLIMDAAMQGKSLHAAHLRSYCESDSQMVEAVKMADRNGVDIKGQLSHDEWQALKKAVGSVR